MSRFRSSPTDPLSRECAAAGIDEVIRVLRGERVILDVDLARIYGVETRVLKQGVRRNSEKFPSDFVFELTPAEVARMQHSEESNDVNSRSQFVTLKQGQNVKHLPFAFTEHGAMMAANILNSAQAVQMSVFVVRAFVKMRSILTGTGELTRKLAALEHELKARLDTHESAIVDVLQRIMALLEPPAPPPELPRGEMGFHSTLAPKPAGSI